MGPGDRPESLTPSEHSRYMDGYVPDKLKAGEIPRTPLGWRDASAAWRTRYVQGKTLEKGLDVVFGLTASGWQREVPRVVDLVQGKEIRVDLFLDKSLSVTAKNENTEAKTGNLNKDIEQLSGYLELLRQGETVRLFTRAERDKEMSKEARALLAAMKAEFPSRFTHRSMNERVYQRIMEAGARASERERRQAVEADLDRLPEREPLVLTVTEVAQEYVKEAPTADIVQLRSMERSLREWARTQAVVERDLAIEARKGLGLRFHAAQDLEKAQESQLAREDGERQTAVDGITFILSARERELIDRGTQEAAQELSRQVAAGRINLEQAREQFQGLAYALGRNQELERRTERDAAARSPEAADKIGEQLHTKEEARRDKDREVSQQIGAIGAVIENEIGRRERVELTNLAVEVNRERLLARGVDAEKARLQAPAMPAPVLQPSDRGKDPRVLMQELGQRDRDDAAARQKAMDARVASLVEKGVPADAARSAVLARLSSSGQDHRSNQDRELERVEQQLLAARIPPAIARAAAEGRIHERRK